MDDFLGSQKSCAWYPALADGGWDPRQLGWKRGFTPFVQIVSMLFFSMNISNFLAHAGTSQRSAMNLACTPLSCTSPGTCARENNISPKVLAAFEIACTPEVKENLITMMACHIFQVLGLPRKNLTCHIAWR